MISENDQAQKGLNDHYIVDIDSVWLSCCDK